MNLYFFGHSYKYAAEQMLLTMFPQERPVYPDGEPTGDRGELSLSAGEAACRLIRQGRAFEGKAVVEPYANDRERVRMEQRAVKLAFYRAALASGVPHPAWGALTGVKPGKLMAQYLRAGKGWADFAADFDVSPDRARLCQRTAQAALDAKASLSPGDVGLYVGIPFCPTRCAYCSFISSAVGGSRGMIEPYLNALSR
ncbi:MAG: coproporphyrinogen dehydrogenase HemZ, partial [Oscillospiraceae bacterium]|nr:coproporphyrinogen dehydrogenase HemZ [Oscillospiraceae bacterium]